MTFDHVPRRNINMRSSDNLSQSEGEQGNQQGLQQETSQQVSGKKSAVTAAREASDTSTADVIRVYVILGLIAGLWYLLKHPEIKFIASPVWWWLTVTGVVVLVLVFLFLPYTRKW